MANTRQQGRQWELAVEAFLCRRGLQTLRRNYSCRFGEIDLVMLDGPVLVFVEVRYRRSERYGSGADSVTPAKQRRISTVAQQFLGRYAAHAQRPCRFDVVSIRGEGERAEIDWIRDAFEAV